MTRPPAAALEPRRPATPDHHTRSAMTTDQTPDRAHRATFTVPATVPPADRAGLRSLLADAIRAAACPGDACPLSEVECAEQRIQPGAWEHGVLSEVSGRPEQFADVLLAALARIGQMADHWEQQLPEVIRTPAVVSAIRAALERADAPATPAAGQSPADTGEEA